MELSSATARRVSARHARPAKILLLSVMLGGQALACQGAIPSDLYGWVKYYAAGFGLDHRLVSALIWTESKFCQYNTSGGVLTSSSGALGLGQLMPGTAAGMGINPNDSVSNIYGSARYLRQLWDTFHDWPLAIAAYNAGPGNVTKYGGIPPFPETVNYVNTVYATYAAFQSLP